MHASNRSVVLSAEVATHLQGLKVANGVKPRPRVEHLVHLDHLGGGVLKRNANQLTQTAGWR